MVAINALIVIVVTVAAQHAHAEPRVEELDAELRELLLSHVRPLSSRNEVGADPEVREAA